MPESTPDSDRESKLEAETRVFAGKQNDLVRSVAWSAIPYFGQMLNKRLQLVPGAKQLLGDRQEKRALTLACGDMTGEYRIFKRLGVTAIDAWDLSEGQRQRCYDKVYDGEIALDYRIADVNELQLSPATYDVVYMQQSLHHIEAIEHILEQIAGSLAAGGVFILNDYVGEPFLQRGPKQREVCRRIWKSLPARLRTNPQDVVLEDIWIPKKEMLSPFEAIRSDAILPGLRANFDTHAETLFGGIIFPIVNNFAPRYDLDDESDLALIKLLWELDEMLGAAGLVEPTFVRGIYGRKSLAPLD